MAFAGLGLTLYHRRHTISYAGRPLLTRDRAIHPALSLLIYLAVFAAVFHNFFFHSIIYRDSFHLFAPIKYLVAEGLGRGEVFGWLPWQYLGMPFVGYVEAGWFYPLNLIYLALPFEPAHKFFILVHYPMAAWFAWLLARRLGLSWETAFFSGLAFALSGYLVSMHSMMTMLIGPAWAPLAFYFLVRAMEDGAWWAAGVGAVLAMQLFGGDPQSALVTASLVSGFGLIVVLQESVGGGDKTKRRRAIASLAIAGVCALLLSAAQLLPAAELTAANARGGGLHLKEAGVYSLHPARLIEFVWPTPFGINWPRYNYWARFALDSPDVVNVPWSISNYLGLPVICLAGWWLMAGHGRWRLWVGAGIAFFLVLALGRYAGLFELLHRHLPLFDMFRYPAKYLAWFTGLAVVAAAFGLEEITRRLKESPSGLSTASIAYMAAVAAFFAAAYFAWPHALAAATGAGPGSSVYDSALAHLRAGGVVFLIVNMSAGALLLLAARGTISARTAVIVFLLLMLFDWRRASVSIMPAGPSDIYDSPSAVAEAIHPGGRPPLGEFRHIRLLMNYNVKDRPGEPSPLVEIRRWERDTLCVNLDTMEGFEDLTGFNAGRPVAGLHILQRAINRVKDDRDPRLFELYNVRYLISPFDREPAEEDRSETVFGDRALDVRVTRLVHALPRAYWVPAAVAAKDKAEAMDLLDRVDPRRRVVITTVEEIDEAEAPGPASASVEAVEYLPDRVRIDVESERSGWLVLNDRWFSGWKARVDGEPARIYKANVFVRAVRVRAGRHEVEFAYRPLSISIGGAVSLLAWSGLLIFGLISIWRRRVRGKSAQDATDTN